MNTNSVKTALLALLASTALAIWPQAAVAGNDEVLIKLLEVLHQDGTISTEAYEALIEAATAAEEHDATVEAPPAAVPSAEPEPERVRVDFGSKGLEIESADGDYAFELGGRLHVDATLYDDDEQELGSGTEVRRIRLAWGATFARDWQARMGVDFGEDELALRGTYLRYVGFDPVRLTLGNFKEYFSLERLNSSNYTTFMERAAPATAFAPGRNVGLGVSTSGDRWSLDAGFFGEGAGDDEEESDDGWAFTGRGTVAPILDDGRLLHLGAAGSYRGLGDDSTFRLRERAESHATDVRLVNTGTISDVDAVTRYAVEAAAVLGPVSLQGEWLGATVARGAGGGDLNFDGWYAYASWFPTGESRSYSKSRRTFGRIKPKHPVGEGGIGAWELGARFSRLDLTDDDIIGGEQDVSTIGLNWYPVTNVRFMANYVDVLDLDRPGDPADGDEPSAFQMRTQVNF